MSTRPFAARFGERVIARPWHTILIATALVLLAAAGIARLEMVGDYRIFFDDDNPQLLALENFEQTYGKNENVVFLIVPEDGDATSRTALLASLWLTDQGWQTPYSRRVDSIANFQYTTADGDDLFVRDLVDPARIDEAAERAKIREIALAEPRIAGAVLGRNGDVSVVSVTIELPAGDQLAPVSEVAEFARGVARSAEERFPGIGVRVVGTVLINHTFIEESLNSQMVFLPASLAIMAIILGVVTRSAAGVATTGAIMVFSILASMGLGGWAGMPFSPPISPAPTIVLMIVVANCVHLLVTLQQRMLAGMEKREAIIASIEINLHPVFLASLTTALGFLSMNFSEVPPYRDLGNFVALGITACFALSVTFLPAMLALLPIKPVSDKRLGGALLGATAKFALAHRKAMMLAWGALIAVMLMVIPRNELNDVLVHFFDERVEFRQDTDFMDEHLSGNTVLEFSLEAAESGGVTDPLFLAEVAEFGEWLETEPAVRHVSVVTDTFKQLNKSMHGDDPSAYRIPASKELAAQYLLLYELSLPIGLDLNNQIDTTRSATRVTVSAETLYSNDLLALNERASAWLEEHASHTAAYSGTGPSALFAYIGQRNIRAMVLGTLVVLLAISAILLFALKSIRLGLVSVVPNVLPALVGFGVWGLTVGQVSLALSVVAAMTVGIVVDDTVHLLAKYRRARQTLGYDPERSIHYAFETAGRALFTTTMVLVCGFMIFALSTFIPTAQVGVLASLIIATALVADLSLLPALLLAVDRDKAGE